MEVRDAIWIPARIGREALRDQHAEARKYLPGFADIVRVAVADGAHAYEPGVSGRYPAGLGQERRQLGIRFAKALRNFRIASGEWKGMAGLTAVACATQ